MPSVPKYGIVALCDNVYKDEQSNKAILSGVYSGGVVLEKIPYELRVGIYIELYIPDTLEHELELIFFEGSKRRGGAKVRMTSLDPEEPTSLFIPQFGIHVPKPLSFELKASYDGGRAVSLIKKKISLRNSSPTALPPLDEQS